MGPHHPLVQATISSAKFAKRRAAIRLFDEKPEIDTLIIDVDRTITVEDSPKIALQMLVGEKKTHEIFDSFIGKVVRGKLKLEELHAAVFGELYSRGFQRSDWVSIMERLDRDGGLRRSFIEALVELSEKESLTLVLATRASIDSAKWLAKRFGFHHAVGSVERVNGTFEGFDSMIGAYDDGNGMMTKITAASKALALSGKVLDSSATAVIANDLLDALEMLRCSRGLLFMPAKPNRLERITSRLGLYDIILKESSDMPSQLSDALGFSS